VLLLPPFGLLRGSSQQSAGDGYSVTVVSAVPALPPGLAPASRFYQIYVHKNSSGAVSISLPLLDPKSPSRGLSFYTYQSGAWQRMAAADPAPDGNSGQGQLQRLPANLILLKRMGSALQVIGGLPPGKTLSPEAAPELTVLSPGGFTPQQDGTVSGDEPPAIPGAQYDVVPAVAAVDGDPVQAVNSILGSPQKQATHVNALASLASRPGNNGVELDYLAVAPQSRQAYVDMVTALAAQLHQNHHELIVEIPAPTLVGSGWNTGAYDWSSLSKAADYLKLLPALDESVYRKQMPDLLQFLTANAGVDAGKLVLVTSPYTVEKTDVDTRLLTRLSALSIASQIQIQARDQAFAGSNVTLLAANLDHDSGGSGLIWDSTTATVSFVYKVGDATHVVWIENQFSEGFKLEYAELYHLGGIAVDDASNDPSLGDVWPAVTQFIATGAPPLLQPNPGLLVPTWLVDGKPLTSDGKTIYSWSAPPQAGDHTVSLIVSDGAVRVIGSTQVTLRANPTTASTVVPGSSVATATPRAAPLTATPGIRTPAAVPSASGGR